MIEFRFCKYGCLILMLVALSCSSENISENKPETMISKEKMAAVLADIHIAEAGVNRQMLTSDSTTKLFQMFYGIISKKHDINFKDFLENYEYYLSKPVLMDSIYNKAIEILNSTEANERANFLKNNQSAKDTSNITIPIQVNQ